MWLSIKIYSPFEVLILLKIIFYMVKLEWQRVILELMCEDLQPFLVHWAQLLYSCYIFHSLKPLFLVILKSLLQCHERVKLAGNFKSCNFLCLVYYIPNFQIVWDLFLILLFKIYVLLIFGLMKLCMYILPLNGVMLDSFDSWWSKGYLTSCKEKVVGEM